MPADLVDRPVVAKAHRGIAGLIRLLYGLILVLLGVLLVEVLFEAWIQEILANRHFNTSGPVAKVEGDLPAWPKQLKNGVLLTLVAASAAKIAIEGRWREFRTKADVALAVLLALMILAGLVNDSSPLLIGQALFVYVRGAIVFYAVRALNPSWPDVKKVLWVVGGAVGVNLLVALVQMVFGRPAYTGVGLVDLAYANLYRAHGLLDHPNHLGHVLGLVLIGLFAWMIGLPRVSRQWWLAFGAVALGVAATQSRESAIAMMIAGCVIWYLRRGGGRTAVVALTIVGTLFVGHLLVRPGNVAELSHRLRGFVSAFETPSGTEDCAGFETNDACMRAKKVAPREIRVLFFQQGFKLLLKRPLLGYGVGHFGGIVAETNDPDWDKDPRFGPDGFNLHDFTGTTLDSFWLHLVVEVGLLGFLAYLVWLALVAAPLVRSTRRFANGGRTTRGPTPAADTHPAIGWGIGSLVFAVLVAFLAPALEDPLFPMLLFAIVGLAWVVNARPAEVPSVGVTGTEERNDEEHVR